MGDYRKEKIKNKDPNRFRQTTCGGVHANNQKTFRRTHLDHSPHYGDMDFLSSFEWKISFIKLLH